MTKKLFYYWCACYLLISFGCVPPSEKQQGKPQFDINNPIVQKMYVWQNQQAVDSLTPYLDNPDPLYRFNATKAFSSLTSDKALDLLTTRLTDSIAPIKAMAAYAVGQQDNQSTLPNLLSALDKTNRNSLQNMQILEAVGKVGNQQTLEQLVNAQAYRKADDTLNLGKALAIYEFGNNKIFDPKATEFMVKAATEQYPNSAALVASAYLARFSNIDLQPYKFTLLQALKKESDPFIKMNLVTALSKLGADDILDPLFEEILASKNDQIAYAGLHNLGDFNYIKTIERVLDLLKNNNENIALGAVNYIAKYGKPADAFFYINDAAQIKHPSVKIALFGNVLSLIQSSYPVTRKKIETELTNIFNNANNDYTKREVIRALGKNIISVDVAKQLANDSQSLLLQTAVTESMASLLSGYVSKSNKYSQRTFGKKLTKDLYQAMATKDPGNISAALYGLNATPKEILGDQFNVDSLLKIRENLQYPVDLEPIYLLHDFAKKMGFGDKFPIPTANVVHSFDSTLFNNYPDTIQLNIKTTKGLIVATLFKNHAPTTVSNFMELVDNNFYNDKYFHRVVPNFVIQAGCPRGDGYGSLDYTLPSEFSPTYRYLQEGLLGMASMGPHTESSQFFITHVPTPQLNGRYTIFGKVIKGMDVVNNIQVGDKILSITY